MTKPTFTAKRISQILTHTGTHLDEFLAIALGYTVSVLMFDPATIRFILDHRGITNAVARSWWEDGIRKDGKLFFIPSIGVTPNNEPDPVPPDKMWRSPFDDHGLEEDTSAFKRMYDFLGGRQGILSLLAGRYRQVEKIRVSDDTLRLWMGRVEHMMAYVTLKDNTPTAMKEGLSRIFKFLARLMQFRTVKTAEGEARTVEFAVGNEEQRELLRMSLDLFLAIMVAPADFTVTDARQAAVEKWMVRWYCRNPETKSLWRPQVEEGVTTIDQLSLWLEKRIRNEAHKAKQEDRPFSPPRRQVRQVQMLQNLMLPYRLSVNWQAAEAWTLERWFHAKPERIKTVMGTTPFTLTSYRQAIDIINKKVEGIDADVARLESLKELEGIALENRDTQVQQLKQTKGRLGSIKTSLEEQEMELDDARALRETFGGDERMDERSPKSPYGFVALVAQLIERTKAAHSTLHLDTLSVSRFTFAVLDMFDQQSYMRQAAQKEVNTQLDQPGHVLQTNLDWAVEGVEWPSVAWVDGNNPEAAGVLRSVRGQGRRADGRPRRRYPVYVVTHETDEDGTRFGSCYVGADQRYLGLEWVNAFFRELSVWARILELKVQVKHPRADDPALEGDGRKQDHVWFAHGVDRGSDILLVQLMARSLTHRDTPGTQLDAKTVIVPLVTLCYSVFVAMNATVRSGGGTGELDPDNIRTICAYFRKELAASTDVPATISQLGSWLTTNVAVLQEAPSYSLN